MYNFIKFGMLTPKNWGLILTNIYVSKYNDIYSPELFFFIYPLMLNEHVVEKFIVSKYANVDGLFCLDPVGIISLGDHPLVKTGTIDSQFQENLESFCLATGRLSNGNLCFSGVLHSIDSDEIGKDLLPDKLEEAGILVYEDWLEFGPFESDDQYEFVGDRGRQHMTTKLEIQGALIGTNPF